jgi:hypothetical protein
MRAILLILLAGLLPSCLSSAREREVHCLAVTMMDVWQSDDELTRAEQLWRTAQQAASERAEAIGESSMLSVRVVDPPAVVGETGATPQPVPFSLFRSENERTLHQRVVAARAHYREASRWYGLVARRVQTRIEEDEMLYPVLGMLATSAAILVYPLVRWNVRSVLWDGADPDAEDDPVQHFCIGRLEAG